jgi:O-antigen biosynthesis protein
MKHILCISHDAHFHGAQLLSLAIVTSLSRRLGFEVTVVLLNEGELIPRFEEVSTVVEFWKLSAEEQDAFLAACRRKTSMCIANTVVSGTVLPQLKAHGYRVVSLIHELPTLIRAYKLEGVARCIAETADAVVFPSTYVSTRFESFALVKGREAIRPQGQFNPPSTRSAADVAECRKGIGLPEGAPVVLGVGFADIRKGIDLFVQNAAILFRRRPDLHFVWVGNLHQDLAEWIMHDVDLAGLRGRMHFVPKSPDISMYYQLADILLVTSREDPFPSTVMEGISAGAYVIGFDGAGGFVDLLGGLCGEAVPYLDLDALSHAVERAIDSHCSKAARRARVEHARLHFSFDDYVDFVLGLARPPLSVSAVVPNYNYGSLIYERLKSIALQDYSPSEIIVLDDFSTDHSRSEIERFVADFGACVPIRTLFSDRNSGSVFAQWKKGLEQATGELVWIAEADDVAAPDFLSSLAPRFAESEVCLAYSQSRQLDGEGQEIAPDYLEYVSSIDPVHWLQDYINDGVDEIRRFMAIKNTIPNVSAVLFRRPADLAFVTQVMQYRVAGDWMFYLHLLRRGKLAFSARALNGHRRHAGSQTSQLAAQQHFDEVASVQDWIDSTWGGDADTRARSQEYREFLKGYLGLAKAASA